MNPRGRMNTRHAGFTVYLVATIGLLWLVQDSLGGWKSVGAVAAMVSIYFVALLDGARMQRETDTST